MPVRTFRFPSRLLGTFVCACALLGCSKPKLGQSGSEELPEPPHGGGGATVPCPCTGGPLTGTAARATVLDQAGATVTLRVEEVVAGEASLQPGDVVEGQRYDDVLICYLGCAGFEEGDQVLAMLGRPANAPAGCAARAACVEACDIPRDPDEQQTAGECPCRDAPAPHDDRFVSPTCGGRLGDVDAACRAHCEQETAGACAAAASVVSVGNVQLSPWADPIVFARRGDRDISVPIAALAELWPQHAEDRGEALRACRDRFGDWADLLDRVP
jgi:hypothetical protein